jgi:hypothetical protein
MRERWPSAVRSDGQTDETKPPVVRLTMERGGRAAQCGDRHNIVVIKWGNLIFTHTDKFGAKDRA